jgi:plastocyanin
LKTKRIILVASLIIALAVIVTATPFELNGTTKTTTTTTIIPAATATTKAPSSSNNKIFSLFSAKIEEVDLKKLGISGDVYSLPIMLVNKGDTVTVHFYNLEKDASKRHSFTIGAPYSIDKDLVGGQDEIATFTADNEGVFQYFDKYHPQTMTGQLVVLSK